jgi:hypothetical protein
MKKNQDKRNAVGKSAGFPASAAILRKQAVPGKKSGKLEITLVPLNLRSKF